VGRLHDLLPADVPAQRLPALARLAEIALGNLRAIDGVPDKDGDLGDDRNGDDVCAHGANLVEGGRKVNAKVMQNQRLRLLIICFQ
jgi:hypothetical protein